MLPPSFVPPLPAQEAHDDLVFAERVRLLQARTAVVLSALVANGALLTFVLGGGERFGALGHWWLAVVAATSAGRILLARRYASRPRAAAEAPRWALLSTAMACLSGVVWGLAGALFYVPGALSEHAFLVFVVGGTAGAAAATNFTFLPAALAFAIPGSVPLLARLLLDGDRAHVAMALVLVFFIVTMALVGKTAARAIQDSVRMRFRNEALAEHYRREVVEHRSAAGALRESEALFRDLAERAIVGVYLIQDGVFRYANPRMAEIFGYSPDELHAGLPASALTHPDDRALVVENLRRRISSEISSMQYEFRGRRKTGEIIAVEVFGSRTAYRGRPAVVGTLLDVTARKRTEQEELRAEKLESLGILAGGIAHDFNNLLAAILGDLSVARERDGGDEVVREVLAEAEDAARRAGELTRQLLTFSRGGEPVKRRLSLEPVLRSAASFAVRGSAVRCRCEIAPGLPAVDADEGQLSQVVHNLVLNAVQAMPGGGEVRVTAEDLSQGGAPDGLERTRWVRISVADDGPGIAPDAAGKIFDPYFTTKPNGSGLGLATVHSIVRRHDGHVRVESQPGRGATFQVYLRAADGPPCADPAAAPAPARGTGRVVVMDDDELVRRATSRMLSQLGYEPVPARDGAELVPLIQAARADGRPIGAVIMDLTIPGGMGGKEAIRLLRAHEPDVKAIVSSGYSSDPVMAEFAAHGFDGVVAKPYRLAELAGVLRGVLDAPRSRLTELGSAHPARGAAPGGA